MNRFLFSSLLTCFLLGSFSIDSCAQTGQFVYTSPNLKATYNLLDGRFEGLYTSSHKNGKAKSEGQFHNNYRIGAWKYFDTKGSLLLERNYLSPFETGKANEMRPFEARRGNDGGYEYFAASEEMIVWSKRVWRSISPKQCPIIFKNNQLYKAMLDGIESGSVRAYSAKDDSFTEEIGVDPKLFAAKIITGYRIKEDFFFDNVRNVMEARQIGIAPIVGTGEEARELFWVYWPQLRGITARRPVAGDNIPESIQNLDDVFFFRYFGSTIIKETNSKDQSIAEMKKGLDAQQKEALRIELSIHDEELKLWEKFLVEVE